MGAPANKAAEGATEVWGFASGNGMTVASASYDRYGGDAVSSSRFCNINIVFAGGQVAPVLPPTEAYVPQGLANVPSRPPTANAHAAVTKRGGVRNPSPPSSHVALASFRLGQDLLAPVMPCRSCGEYQI